MEEPDDTLIKILKDEFTSENMDQFINNFQLYLKYGNQKKEFVINLEDIWQWIGFYRKDYAKRVLTKNFKENYDFIIKMETFNQHGGHNKETIMMTVDTFKSLCMLSNTDKGKQTRLYYLKMEDIFFKYIQEKNIAIVRKELMKEYELNWEKKIIEAYDNKTVIYLIKIDDNIIKLGETGDIRTRMITHRQDYSNCVLLNVFECLRAHKFEQYLIHRKDFQKNLFSGNEIFKLTDDFTYEHILKVIERHHGYFNCISPTEQLKFYNTELKIKVANLVEKANTEEEKIRYFELLKDNHESDEEDDDQPFRHRYVYQYDPSNLTTPINTFYSLRQAARSLNNPTYHDYHIRNASINNTLFANYRWYYMDTDEDNPPELPATVNETTKKKNTGLIAQIKLDKSEIINVYSNQQHAEKMSKIPNCQISIAISKNSVCRGFYWMLYDNCSDDLKNKYTKELPKQTRVSTSSKKVQKIDPNTNKVIETYNCIQHVCNLYNCCHKSIKLASTSGNIFKSYKWNIV